MVMENSDVFVGIEAPFIANLYVLDVDRDKKIELQNRGIYVAFRQDEFLRYYTLQCGYMHFTVHISHSLEAIRAVYIYSQKFTSDVCAMRKWLSMKIEIQK